MKKGSISSVAILFGMILIFSAYSYYNYRREMITLTYQSIISIIRHENYLLEKEKINQELKTSMKTIMKAQTLNQSGEIDNLEEWGYPLLVNYSMDYEHHNNINVSYKTNETIKIYYPVKDFLEKTSGIGIEEIESCYCLQINQDACNSINSTSFVWEAEVCSGLPIKLKARIHINTTFTKKYPYYLFGGLCEISC